MAEHAKAGVSGEELAHSTIPTDIGNVESKEDLTVDILSKPGHNIYHKYLFPYKIAFDIKI